MSETLFTRGTADQGYGADDRDIIGNRGADGAESSKTVLQDIIQSDEVQGFLSPWKAIGKGIGSVLGPGVKALDESLSFGAGVKTLSNTATATRMGLPEESATQFVQERREADLEAATEANPYGIGPGPLAGILGGAEGAWSYGVARPASTSVMLVDPENPYYDNDTLVNAVKDTWNRSEVVSFGQAATANDIINKTNPLGLIGNALRLNDYDIYSDTDMALAQYNPFYQAITGTTDATLELGIPVNVIKPLRLAAFKKAGIRTSPFTDPGNADLIRSEFIQHRAFVEGTDLGDELGGLQAKRTGIGYQVYKIAETTDSDLIARNPLVQSMDGIDQVRMTEILARTDDPNTVYNIIAGAGGDVRAISELAEAAPDTVWILGDAKSAIFDNALNDIPYRPTGAAAVKANQVFESSAAADQYFADVRNILVSPDGTPYVGTTRMPQGYLVERVRSATGDITYKWNTGDFSNSPGWVRAIAESRFPGGPITHFMHWVGGKQPLGRVSRSSARPNDVMIEFDAMVNNVPLFRGTKELEYGIAPDGSILRMPANEWVAQQRQRIREGIAGRNLEGAWRQVEDDAIYTLALTIGYSHDVALDAVRQARNLRGSADDIINYLENDGGVLFSEQGDRIVYSPETRSMLLDSFDTMDLLAVYDELNWRAPNNARRVLAAGNRLESISGNVFDNLQRFFRSNVLLRLGYAPKNSIGEPWIAAMIAHGTILTDEGLVPASKNFIKNRQNWARRQQYRIDLINRVKAKFGRGDGTVGTLRKELEQAVREYVNAREAYAVAAADLEAVKQGLVPPSKIPVVEQRSKSVLFQARQLMDSIERTLDDQVPDWRQVVPPASITDVGERLRELRAITGEDLSLLDDLYRERQDIVLRADAEAMTPLRSIDAEIAGLTEEIHHLQDIITIHEAKLDHISVAAVKGVDAQAPKPTLTRVRRKDGSETVYYGDRRTVFERHYVPQEDYRGWHRAPSRDFGGPLNAPDEFLPDLNNPAIWYGEYTNELRELVQKVHGDPDAYITVYRAMPEGSEINPGDWVSPFKGYAERHAGDMLEDGWVIKSKKVRAGDLYTEGNSPAEWGWDPKYQDDVLEVEVIPGNDSSEVQMAVGRDLRGVSLQRQMDLATTRLDELSQRRSEYLRTGVDALRESKMSVNDKARLAAIDEQLSRILALQTDEFAVSRVTVAPDARVSTVDDVRMAWGPDTDPYFFPQPRSIDPDVAVQLDSFLGADEFSVQDGLRAIWNAGDQDLQWDLAIQIDGAREFSEQGVKAADIRAVQDIVQRLEDNGMDLAMQADPYSMVKQFAEGIASSPDEAARMAAVVDRLEDLRLEGGTFYRVLGSRGDVQDLYERMAPTMGGDFGSQELRQAVRERHYKLAQDSLEAQGYAPGDLVSVWRTGDEVTNNGVVAVTTEPGGLANFAGQTVEYKVRRDRVLFDAIASREARDQQSLAPQTWTAKEKELGLHMNDLIPVREYAPVLRQVDTAPAVSSPNLRDVTGKFGGDRYAIVTNASQFKKNNVIRAKISDRDAPTGKVKVDDVPEVSPEAIQMLPAKEAERLVQDLRIYATAKFFDSPAEVMEYVRVVDPDATDILIEDALRRTRDTAQAAFDGSIPVHQWIDEFFDEYWGMRFRQTSIGRPDIGVGLSDVDSPWWDIDPSEIALVRTGEDILNNNNTRVYESTLDFSVLDFSRNPGQYTDVWWAYGDISPTKGTKPTVENPVMSEVRVLTEELQEMYDQAVREVDRNVDGSADAMRAAEKKMAEAEERIKELTVKLGGKEAKIDSVSGNRTYYGSGRGTMTLNVNGKKFEVAGPLADDQYALGQQWAAEVSAENTTRFTYDPSFKASSRGSRIMDGSEVVPIDRFDPRYWDQLAYDVNAHFRSDPLVGKILEGWNKKEVADWLRTPEGKAHARGLGKDYLTTKSEYSTPVRGITIDQPVNVMISEARDLDEIFDIIYAYIPNADVRKWIANRQGTGVFDDGRNIGVTAGELKALLGAEDELSRIMSARGEWSSTGVYQDVLSNSLDRVWQFIGTMPEDRLSRWPFFTREFRTQIENRAAFLDQQSGGKISLDDLQALRQSSRRAALKELEKTFYNIRRYNNAVYTSRFLMSFPGAFFNSLYRYGRFAAREPERMLTGALIAGDVLRVVATDPEGNPITEQNIGDATWIVVPGTKKSEFDPGLRFPVNSLATMVVDYPGLSFAAAYSVAEFVKRNPKNDERLRDAMSRVGAEDLYEEWFPFGPPSNPVSGFFGAWQKDLWRWLRGPSDTDFIRASVYFYADDMAEWEKGGMQGEAPTFEQAGDKTEAFFRSRMMLKNVSPLSVDTQPPGQIMRNAWYAFREDYPNDTAQARVDFMKKYGDWARWYTYSPSEYTTYLPASTEMYERVWEKHPNLVRELVSLAGSDEIMNYVGLIALDVDNTFNPTVNNYLKNNPLPGDDVTVSRRISPERFANIVAVNDGWALYGQYATQYEAEMARLRDLRDNSISTGQQDYYRQKIYETEQEWKRWQREGPLGENVAWQNDRAEQQDRSTIASNFLKTIVNDKKFSEEEGKSYFWQQVKRFVENEEQAWIDMQAMKKPEDKAEHRANFRLWLSEELFPEVPEFRPVFERYFKRRWDPDDVLQEEGGN